MREHQVEVGARCLFSFLLGAMLLAGCTNADHARQEIRNTHLEEVKAIVDDDVVRHRRGIAIAANMFKRGFIVEDPANREQGMRTGLRYVQEPGPRAISEFVASPMSFFCAVDKDGIVIARDVADAEDDSMKGQNFAERFQSVRTALTEGTPGYELGEFPAVEEGAASSHSMLFVHPAKIDGEVVGALIAGIPLWRMAQRLGRQLQGNHAAENGLVLWVYAYKGADLHHFGTPELLDPLIPDGAARTQGLSSSPGGYTGEIELGGRSYGYGVVPFPRIGEDVGMVLIRSDPVN